MINLIWEPIRLLAASCDNTTFLGLRPWWYYLDVTYPCDIKKFTILPSSGNPSDLPLVALALVDDLLRISALVAIAFIIVGSVRMITSSGNPEQTASAQSTVINALIGLAIAIVSVAFVGFVGRQLSNP